VAERESQLRCSERGGERRVYIPRNEYEPRLRCEQHGLESLDDKRGLLRVRTGPDAEMMVGFLKLEIVEKRLRHRRVVVLPGVNENVPEAIAVRGKGCGDGSDLDEVRTRPDDRDDCPPTRHAGSMPRRWSPVVTGCTS
jgi:hypothetical protein